MILYTLGILEGEGCREDGVFAQVFVGAATHGEALDVDGGAEDDVLATQASLLAHAGAVFVGKFLAPGGGEGASGGEVCGGVKGPAGTHKAVGLAFLTYAEGAVGIVDVGDAKALDACAGHIGLAVKHVDLLFQRHLGDEGVDSGVVDGEPVLRGEGAAAGGREQQGGSGE